MKGKSIATDSAHMIEFASQSSNLNLIDASRGVWIVDTRATNHMCDLKLFDSVKPIASPKPVHLSNATSIKVTHAGTITLNKAITLTNVLYIPAFKCNLLSVSAFT